MLCYFALKYNALLFNVLGISMCHVSMCLYFFKCQINMPFLFALLLMHGLVTLLALPVSLTLDDRSQML